MVSDFSIESWELTATQSSCFTVGPVSAWGTWQAISSRWQRTMYFCSTISAEQGALLLSLIRHHSMQIGLQMTWKRYGHTSTLESSHFSRTRGELEWRRFTPRNTASTSAGW